MDQGRRCNVSAISKDQVKYLQMLAEPFQTLDALRTEIARIGAEISLPKGTEHFMSDIHGEYEAFCHIVRNCSGVIREKVRLWLGDRLKEEEADALCTLIYYPEETLRRLHQTKELTFAWYREKMDCLLHMARMLSSKYTRAKVRRMMPDDWAFLLDEVMHYQNDEGDGNSEQSENRRIYYDAILSSLIRTRGIDEVLIALAELIRKLAVDRLHVVGDIYDRGARADSIMDILMAHRSVDIEWGNHDILWMGAASGSLCCIAGVLRNSLSYGNMEILEKGYGISLRELTLFAEKTYPDLPRDKGMVWVVNVMMFKLEGQLVRRNPEFQMEDRLLLHRIDAENRTITVDGKTWSLREEALPTLSAEDPYRLTPEEERVMEDLRDAFTQSLRLREHISFLYRRGWMYRVFNGNLLFHGCVPMNPDGSFRSKVLEGGLYSGKALMDYADRMARRAYYEGDQKALDFMWYLWCGTDSPVCGREVKTFARAFIPDREAWEEPRNAYYDLYNDEAVCRLILAEFGLTGEESRIVNGHTPIRVKEGESPLKAGGRLLVIDGGFSKPYQKTTGIAGYTLIANSHGMRLMSHQPFTSLKDAQESGEDIHSQSLEFATYPRRRYVRDTDFGKRLQERMDILVQLLEACRQGLVTLQK